MLSIYTVWLILYVIYISTTSFVKLSFSATDILRFHQTPRYSNYLLNEQFSIIYCSHLTPFELKIVK